MKINNNAIILSFIAGFLSLSQEILWIRLVSFAHQSAPQAFAFVLGLYLLGISLGAWAGRLICQDKEKNLFYVSGLIFISAMTFDSIAPIIFSFSFNSAFGLPISMLLLIGSAAIRGTIFPIVHHIGSQNKVRIGASVSNIYFSNVIGSTLGPIITGFFLINIVSTQNSFFFINFLTGIAGIYCLVLADRSIKFYVPLCVVVTAFFIIIPDLLIGRISIIRDDATSVSANYTNENRHGIIHTYPSKKGDIVFGGNVYDGAVNIDLRHDINGINRAYIIPIIAPDIKDVLIIGLSSGSWARIISAMPNVRSIHIIEINPGYLDLIRLHPSIAPLLSDPRVHIHIDDGRRWLSKNRKNQFDFILMNTTWHWRSYSTNLVSVDFLRIAKNHLNTNGLIYFNTTDSNDIFYTATEVFPYAYRYKNFVLAGSYDMAPQLTYDHLIAQLATLKWPETGVSLFNMNTADDRLLADIILSEPLLPLNAFIKTGDRPLELVTDQNMLTEFKYGRGL